MARARRGYVLNGFQMTVTAMTIHSSIVDGMDIILGHLPFSGIRISVT